MAKLNLIELLTGNPDRLRYVTRFSTCHRTHQETVAEHSFYVSLYCYFISMHLKSLGFRIDLGDVLTRALIHDLDEGLTGDVPRPFKYVNKTLPAELRAGAATAMEKILETIYGSDKAARAEIYMRWAHGKEDGLEGAVLAFADYLAALAYVWREVATGNQIILTHCEPMRQYLLLFDGIEFEPLRDLVNEARRLHLLIFEESQWRIKPR